MSARSFHNLLVHLFPGAGRIEIYIVGLGFFHGLRHGHELLRHYVREPLDGFVPVLQQGRGELGTGLFGMLLDDWENSAKRFTHIVPKHFLAMQKAMKNAEENNIDFNTPGVWEQVYEQVMEGAR